MPFPTIRRSESCLGSSRGWNAKKRLHWWAGVFFEFLRQVGYRKAVSKHLPFRFTSPNAIDPVETFTAFLLSVVAGARRFAHTSLLRADVALQALLGI